MLPCQNNQSIQSTYFKCNVYDHVLYDVSMADPHTQFTRMVDGLVESSHDDPDLLREMQWLDLQAQQRHISFYDVILEVLYRPDDHDSKL